MSAVVDVAAACRLAAHRAVDRAVARWHLTDPSGWHRAYPMSPRTRCAFCARVEATPELDRARRLARGI